MLARLHHLRRLVPALVLLVAVAAAVSLVRAWPKWQSARLASAWREDLESVDAVRIPALVDHLVDLGDPGLESLVTALASPRGEVRVHAAAAIRRLVDNWEVSDVSARSVAAGKLSALLARHVDDFAPEQRQTAATLVQQLLVWIFDDEFVDRTQLVLDCETVLLAVDSVGDGSDPSSATSAARRATPAPMVDRDLAALARLPGGGLANEPAQPPRLPVAADSSPPTITGDAREPRLLLDGRGDELPPAPLPVVHPEGTGGGPTSANVDGNNRQARANSLLRDESAATVVGFDDRRDDPDTDSPSPATQSTKLLGPTTPREMSLIRLLRSEPTIAAEAEYQLRAIGYGEREISLADSITHPSVDFRLRLVDGLPRTAGIRPRRWLEMMLDDDDARVRLAAIAQLATSGDAALIESLRRRALADPDPAVRSQAERLRPTRSR